MPGPKEESWTQQQIADDLKVPRRTIAFWLDDIANGIGRDIAKLPANGNNGSYEHGKIKTRPIRLFPIRQELGWSNRRIAAHLSLPEATIRLWLRNNSEAKVRRNGTPLALNNIYCMDCLDGLRRLPHNSVDLVFADPPYNIGVDYSNGDTSPRSLPWISGLNTPG